MADEDYTGAVGAYLQQQDTPRPHNVQASLALAADADPEREAWVQRTAQRLGVPAASVRDNQAAIKRQAFVADSNPSLLMSQYPQVAEFLADPDTAAVAKDDIPVMQRLADSWRAFTGGIERGSLQDQLGPLHYRAMRGELSLRDEVLRQSLKRRLQGEGAADEARRGTDWWLSQAGYGGRQMLESVREGGRGAMVGAMVGGGTALALGQAGPQVALPEELVTVPGAALYGGRAGYVTSTILHNYQTEAGFAFDEFSDFRDAEGRPLDRDTAIGSAAAVGLVNAGLETVADLTFAKLLPGVDVLLAKNGKQVVKELLKRATFRRAVAQAGGRWARAATTEAVTEAAQEAVNIVVGELAKASEEGEFESPTLGQAAARVGAAAQSAAASGSAIALPGVAYQGVRDLRRGRAAQQTQQLMQTLGDAASESKLVQRLPEKWRELVAKVRAGGPVEDVFIPVEQFARYWQSAGVDPADVAQEIGVKNYAEALASGSDVAMALEDYATHIAPTEHHGALMQDVRLRPGETTARELAEYEAQRETVAAELGEQAQAADVEAAAPSGERQVYDAMLGELTGRFDRSAADAYATAYARGVATLAERAGVAPLELHQRYGLRVVRPLPEILARAESTDMTLAPLLERLRAGEVPDEAAVFGERLSDFVRGLGGVQDVAGELAGADTPARGQRRLVNPQGIGVDQARELAVERGYLAADSTVVDLLDLLQQDLAGQPVYAAGAQNDEALALRQALDGLSEYLAGLGIDLARDDNAAVQRRIEAETRTDETARVFDQPDTADTTLAKDIDVRRGYIQFGPQRKFAINLLEKADLSTFLHELGHFWLEVLGDLAEGEGAPQQVRDDHAALLAWFGVERRDQITVAHHEQFARAHEAYLREGNAPSPALRSVFQRFKAWLTFIYRQLDRLNVRLNDEVRGVFDRLYAGDAEIEAARREAGMVELFASAADAGMSEVEFAAYRKTVAAASTDAKETLQQQLMREYARAQQAWWQQERATLRDEVAAEVAAQPVYQAFDALVSGQSVDGAPVKLNRAELVERYGAAFLKRLPRGFQRVYSAEGGMASDLAAGLFGFASPDALVQALVDMRPARVLIEAETDARMRERHGDLMLDGTLADEAMAAVHNELQGEVLAAELRALRRQQRAARPILAAAERERREARQALQDSIPPLQAFRDTAAGLIGQKQVRDLTPHLYLTAQQRASREAFAAAARGDYLAAANAKQRELLNHYLYREAVKARDEVERIVDYARRLGKDASQQRLGKAGADYLAQVNTLLEQYEFRPASGRQLDRRRALLAWYEGQIAAGFNPAIDPALLEAAGQRNYREVAVDELRALRDALKSIEHLAKLKNQLLQKGREVAYREAVTQLIASAERNTAGARKKSADPALRSLRDKFADGLERWDAEFLPIETLFEILDGGNQGPWHDYVWHRASEAQAAEYDWMGRLGGALETLLARYDGTDGPRLLDTFNVPGVDGPVTRNWLISVALNVGNRQNYEKLLDGQGWKAEQVDQMLAQLSDADLDFVQQVWDTVNSLWPEVAALEKRVSGVEPEKVEAQPFQVRDAAGEVRRTLAGGYYPLAYDPRRGQAGLKQGSGPLAGLTEEGYAVATSPRGHTKQRTGYVAPLMLDFAYVLQRHLAGVVKDLTHREFLIDANRLFNDQRIRNALQAQLGEAYEAMLMPWLRAVANDRNVSPRDALTGIDRLIESGRTNATTVALGFRVTSMLAQVAGAANAIEYVGARWFWGGLRQAISAPLESYRFVTERSGEMRHRFDTIDRDVRDQLRAMREGRLSTWKARINQAAFVGMNVADRMVTIPTWLGGYAKARHAGLSEAQAVQAADAAVRRSQGAGGAKDLNALQRKRGAIKMLTMFYTPFAAQYGRLRQVGQRARVEGWRYAPEAVMRVLLVTALPAVLAELVTGKGGGSCEPGDTACLGRWAAAKSVSSLTATIPGVREVGAAAEAWITGARSPRDIRVSPVFDMIQRLWDTSVSAGDALVDEDREVDQRLAFDVFEGAGYLLNLPTGQTRVTIEYLYDLLEGDRKPEGPGDVLRGLTMRPRKGEPN